MEARDAEIGTLETGAAGSWELRAQSVVNSEWSEPNSMGLRTGTERLKGRKCVK